MGRVAGDIFAFSDGGSGHVCDLGSAPNPGETDLIFITSVTTIDSVATFTQRDSNVANQATYAYDRLAVGGEGSTVTVDTNNSHPTVVWWERWDNLGAREAGDIISVTNTNATVLPDGATGALAGDGRVVFVMAGLSDIDGADPTTPVWSDGFQAAEAGSVPTDVIVFGGYLEDAPSGGTPVDVVSWTNVARDRDGVYAVYPTATAETEGTLAETAPSATEALTGDTPRVGALAESAPAAGESLVGDVPVVGDLVEGAPHAVDAIAGGADQTGALAEVAPPATEALAGTSQAVTIGQLLAMPTTLVTIYQPSSVPDEWSGERPDDTATASGVPASIIEQVRDVYDPRAGTGRVIRKVTGRVPDGTSITSDSRVVDAEGRQYAVSSVRQARNPMWVGDVVLELVRTDQGAP